MDVMEDCIVIGAGPAGCRTAARLATLGHRVLVLERAAAPGHKRACTGIISLECVRAYDIPDDVIQRMVGGATLYSPSGEVLRVERPSPQAAILDRPAFDTLLAGRTREAGAELRCNCRVTGISCQPDVAVVSYDSPDGPKTLAARAVVLASGYHPNLVRPLRLGGYRYSAVGAQAEAAADTASDRGWPLVTAIYSASPMSVSTSVIRTLSSWKNVAASSPLT